MRRVPSLGSRSVLLPCTPALALQAIPSAKDIGYPGPGAGPHQGAMIWEGCLACWAVC